jgi:CRISPR-associated protein Cas1
MISFGNSILYAKTISIIYNTHLTQSVSFLHSPSSGRFSLSLDLSEGFKPIIVYKTIFDLVNNRKIKVNEHFEKDLNYCLLNEKGREIFIKALEDRLDSVKEHTRLKRKVSIKTLIKLDAYKLLKYILEDKEFEFYNAKKGL